MFFLYEKSKESWGSTKIRGFKIAERLNVKCIAFEDLKEDLQGEIIVCLKFSDYSKLLNLSRKNKIIIDMVDCNKTIESQLGFFKNFNSGIFTSNQQLLKYNNFFKKSNENIIIYHHWDPRLEKIIVDKKNKIKIGYFGVDTKCIYYKKIKEIDYYNVTESLNLIKNKGGISFHDSLKLYKDYNVHFVVKPLEQEQLLQPMTKVANAAAIGCPVICYKNKQYEELLTQSYPYFCNSLEEKAITEVIKKINLTYMKEEWFQSLNIMNDIKNITSLDKIMEEYKKIKKGKL